MRFAFLTYAPPDDPLVWSGTPVYILRALVRAGHEIVNVGPLGPRYPLRERIKSRLYRHFKQRNYIINREPAVFRARGALASRLLGSIEPVDAVIAAYPPDIAFVETTLPIVLIHDATWNQLLDFYPEFSTHRLAPETVAGGHLLERLALRNATRLLYFTRWAADSAVGDYGVAPEKVDIALPGANLDDPPRRDEVEYSVREMRGRGACRLLFIGKDWLRKGGDVAVQIVSELRKLEIDAELVAVGSRPPTSRSLPSFVKFAGFLDKADPDDARALRHLLLSSDFFLMPTRAECAGLVFCEAAAHGVPSLSTDVGGVSELIATGAMGTTLPLEADPMQYARWIAQAYRDRSRYERLALGARQRFESVLNWGSFTHALAATVERAANDLLQQRGSLVLQE